MKTIEMVRNNKWMFVALALALLATGCNFIPFGFTTIKEISDAPANFDGKEIKLKGTVKSVTKVPMLDIKLYMLEDGTGQVTVIPSGDMPGENETIAISGIVENVAIIGGKSLGMHIKETRRLPTFGFGNT
jgi:hypothetical protein